MSVYFMYLPIPLIFGLPSKDPPQAWAPISLKAPAQQEESSSSFALHLNVLAHTGPLAW